MSNWKSEEEIKKALANRLEYLRFKNGGISVKELAQKIGCSDQTLYNAEKTISIPGTIYLDRIAKYFNVSFEYLLGYTEVPDAVMQEIDKLHISEAACEIFSENKTYGHIISLMTESEEFQSLLRQFDIYVRTHAEAGADIMAGISADTISMLRENIATADSNLMADVLALNAKKFDDRQLQNLSDGIAEVLKNCSEVYFKNPYEREAFRKIKSITVQVMAEYKSAKEKNKTMTSEIAIERMVELYKKAGIFGADEANYEMVNALIKNMANAANGSANESKT